MKHLFICSTPLQVINAVNLRTVLFPNDQVNIYLNDHSHGYTSLFNQIKKSNIFNEVHLLKVKWFNKHWLKRYKISRYVLTAIEYLVYNFISKKFIIDENIYDKFWVSFMDRSSWLIFLKCQKINKNIQLNFFEDGIGSYQLLTIKQNGFDKLLLNLLGKKSVFDQICHLYVYEPKLTINTRYLLVKILKLPKIDTSSSKQLINQIFNFNKNDLKLFNDKYIFFDSPFNDVEINTNQLKIINELINCTNNQLAIKLHPATHIKDNSYQQVSDVKTMMELLILNNDVTNNVFISILSTVGITPKLMFGQEPYVIFLFKLIDFNSSEQIGDSFTLFVESFKKTYQRPERIYIPKTINELKKIIANINQSIDLIKRK